MSIPKKRWDLVSFAHQNLESRQFRKIGRLEDWLCCPAGWPGFTSLPILQPSRLYLILLAVNFIRHPLIYLVHNGGADSHRRRFGP